MKAEKLDYVLTVVFDFAEYRRGMKITDEKEIKKVLESEHKDCVVKSLI